MAFQSNRPLGLVDLDHTRLDKTLASASILPSDFGMWTFCSLKLVLPGVRVQCPMRLLSLLPRCLAFQLCGSGIFGIIFYMVPVAAIITETILGEFVKLRKATVNLIMPVSLSVCLSVRPPIHRHGTIRLELDGFSWSFILEYFSKICREFKCL